jgi:hypothetical protein
VVVDGSRINLRNLRSGNDVKQRLFKLGGCASFSSTGPEIISDKGSESLFRKGVGRPLRGSRVSQNESAGCLSILFCL